MGQERELDIVLWGATGFTGQLVAEYLLRVYGTDAFRWGLGGRSQGKLEKVRDALGPAARELPLLIGDAADADSMKTLAGRARVVCTTVGPYALYGSALVAACADSGTHYCDLTGEVHWMRRMIDAHQARAEETGARLVPTCGFDCIPSDLGVLFVQRAMQEQAGVPAERVHCRVKGFSGGASGGTLASMINMMEEAGRDPSVRRVMNDPYGLDPAGRAPGPDGGERFAPAYDPAFRQWTGPFVMGAVNTKVVRRSNALLCGQGAGYGDGFSYEEAMLMGDGPLGLVRAAGLAAGLAGGMAAFAVGPIRRALAGRLPAPGEGPSLEKREAGYWDLRFRAEAPGEPERALYARLTGDRDPGYGSTSKMLGEAAVSLALDPLEVGGGFWTPASAMGQALIDRLQKNAGVTFALEDGPA